jgi:hypothetical protein
MVVMTHAAIAVPTVVTTPNIDGIYGQAPTLNATPITINYLPTITLYVWDSLRTIDDAGEYNTLKGMAPSASPVVNAFYVVGINWCGVSLANIVGCADTPGNFMALDHTFMQGASGNLDIAHELGHNLGLAHVAEAVAMTGDNLMNPTLWGSTVLTAGQAVTIFGSALVQTDILGDLYIDIQPVSLEVPEPASLAMLGLAMAAMVTTRRRRALA